LRTQEEIVRVRTAFLEGMENRAARFLRRNAFERN